MYGFFETALRRAHGRGAGATQGGRGRRRRRRELLGVPPGTPLLEVERVAFTYGERPVEFRRGLCSTAAHHYFNALG